MELTDGLNLGNVRFVFIGGKGGVGKTVFAGALSVEMARQGRKVLLASLNPVHSLGSLFMQDLSGGVYRNVQGVEGLTAVEVEINDL
ncbi:MAG: ArsA-related P-loop ATPase, partial [Candidatus Caldarchaeum sp.]|nr:ArsA-related P-loop ATPase [Candidatus Caldarchaeum sp.]